MRRLPLALSFALALGGCGQKVLTVPKAAKIQPAPRDLPDIPPGFAESMISRRRVDGVTVRVYNAGSIVVRGSKVSSIKSWSARTRLDVPVFLVKHPLKGYILFDTGPKAAGAKSDCFNESVDVLPGLDLVSQLRKDGISPADIKTVILSHLHAEHSGAVDLFPAATVYVDQREWSRREESAGSETVKWAMLEPRVKTVDLSNEKAFGAIDHGRDLFGDGTVFLVDLSGHSVGNMGAWLNLDNGPVLLPGDATFYLDNHQDLALPDKSLIFDVDKYWRRLYQMRALQEAALQLVIIPGHDLTVLGLQPRADVTPALPRPR